MALCVSHGTSKDPVLPEQRDSPIQWSSRDALIQSRGGITNSARGHGDNNALCLILDVLNPVQIRIFNALDEESYNR